METAEKKIAERIFNLVILDESGSMTGLEKVSVDGVNETIQTIKAAAEANPQQKQMFSFVTFSGLGPATPSIRVHTLLEEISKVREFRIDSYIPRGNTPLWDTVGRSLVELQRVVTDNDLVLVTIITDGYENASREFTGQMIHDMVTTLSQKGWVFTYIGANQDALQEAYKLGIRNALNFKADQEGTRAMWIKERQSRRMFYEKAKMSDLSAAEIARNYFEDPHEK